METNADVLAQLDRKLASIDKSALRPAFIGFDGFVDSIRKAVKTRKNFTVTYFKKISDFAARLSQAAGKSGQVEMYEQRLKHGGNAPILANALGLLGVDSICVGSMGFPKIDPLFENISTRCRPVSILEPGKSDCVEFEDGKLIFSNLGNFERYTWKYIKDTIGIKTLTDMIHSSRLIALVDWVNVHHADDIWEGLMEDVIKPSGRRDFIFFFDLCDPSKKSPQQIDEILDIIGCYSIYGRVVLGLNENETRIIWSSIEGVDPAKATTTIEEMGSRIYHAMNIDCLMIHPIDRTIAYQPHEVIEMRGRYVHHPKVQTGGGDNLNAGFCLGLLSGMSLPECMLLGMAASGYYVENGSSASIEQLRSYVQNWQHELSLPTKVEKADTIKVS